MTLEDVLTGLNWGIRAKVEVPSRAKQLFDVESLDLSDEVKAFLAADYPDGIYGHQREALRLNREGRNVCLTTSTASGKSLAFYAAGIDELVRDPDARIFALYPLKALASEQKERWEKALESAGLDVEVGSLQGGVAMPEGWRMMRDCRVLTLTPDIIHARVLPNIGRREVREALRNLKLIVLDEVHSYTGVFGSNAAFLLRRLRHCMSLLGGETRFMAASATIRSAVDHLSQLVGLPFAEVGEELETSPRPGADVFLLDPPIGKDLLGETKKLIRALIDGSDRRLIAFMESRKQTEQLATMANRGVPDDGAAPPDEDEDFGDGLAGLQALPFRAGYEEHDRAEILKRLRRGQLRCVVSTSALELGMDISYLDTGILLGVPPSSTSLKQRIGRVGRTRRGEILIVNRGTLADVAVFADPPSVLNRPPAEGALYLGNRRIQYIHALCLARTGGEHDTTAAGTTPGDDPAFESAVDWPEGFLDLCRQDRTGVIDPDLQAMKAEGGEDPHHTFPLRDVEMQFKVEASGPMGGEKGSLSYSQLLREAYPGAIYRYIMQPFRVTNVFQNKRIVKVRRDKSYYTKPTFLPTLLFPNLSEDSVYQAASAGDTLMVECALQVRQAVSGFTERRGQAEFRHPYPLDIPQAGLRFPLQQFSRNFFSTGVVVAHKVMDDFPGDLKAVGEIVYEAFLSVLPFEPRDISMAPGIFRVEKGPALLGHRFLGLYDETYGSLHLSSRLFETDVWRRTLEGAEVVAASGAIPTGPGVTAILQALLQDAGQVRQSVPTLKYESTPATNAEQVEVILPESHGLNLRRANEEFQIKRVFFSPILRELAYHGTSGMTGIEMTVPVISIVPVPGESRMGVYNAETGEVVAGA